MKRLALIIAALSGTMVSLMLVVGAWLSYESGFWLALRNSSSSRLELFLTSEQRLPAYIPALHQSIRRYPFVAVPGNSERIVKFDSGGRQPCGAYVRYGKEVRFWEFDAQTGGRRDLPPFESLAPVDRRISDELDHNVSARGFIPFLLFGTIPVVTFLIWRKILRRPNKSLVTTAMTQAPSTTSTAPLSHL